MMATKINNERKKNWREAVPTRAPFPVTRQDTWDPELHYFSPFLAHRGKAQTKIFFQKCSHNLCDKLQNKFQVTFYPLLLDDSNTMSGIFIKSKKKNRRDRGNSTMSDLDLKGAHGGAPRYQISKGKMEGCKIIWRNILRNI